MSSDKLLKLLTPYRFHLALGLFGLFILGLGLFSLRVGPSPQIEIISEEQEETGFLFVDIEGAVLKPGLHQLPAGSRINDLLIAAGGLSAEADREWVTRNLNLAQPLEDGSKFYISGVAEIGEIREIGGGEVAGGVTGKVNINTASASELDRLWGIGAARAAAIIENRPYSSVEELLTKKVIPSNVYEAIKDKVSVY